MKKIIILLITLFITISLTACGNKTYHEITYTQLEKMLEEKQNLILFIGSKDCSACSAYKITLNKIIKEYDLDIKYIDISKLSEEQKSGLSAHFAFSSTPTTVFITKGKEKDTHNRIIGNQKYSKIIEKLKENKYIKE